MCVCVCVCVCVCACVYERILYGVHKHNLQPQSLSLSAPIKLFLLLLSVLSSLSFSLSIHPPFLFYFTQQLAYGDVHSITSRWRITLLLGCSLALLMSHCRFLSMALMATYNWRTQPRQSPVKTAGATLTFLTGSDEETYSNVSASHRQLSFQLPPYRSL